MEHARDDRVTRRPVLFSVSVTIGFVLLVLASAVAGKASGRPASLEAVGAAGRGVIAAAALLSLAKLGWLRWLAGPGRPVSWLLVVPPLGYVLGVYPPLFTGGYAMSLGDRGLAALVATDGFAAGVAEEIVFRGLVLGALLRAWDPGGTRPWRAVLVSSLLFSAPHALNVLAGDEPLRTGAQLVWALLLGLVFGALVVSGGSIWPVALLHGVANAVIHVNRLGHTSPMSVTTAVLLALAPLPLLGYAAFVLRRHRWLTGSPPDSDTFPPGARGLRG